MTDEVIKRGPGRPRKEPPREAPSEIIDRVQRYKVIAYKVRTSQGRKIEGQFVDLPASEGECLIKQGLLRNADPALRIR